MSFGIQAAFGLTCRVYGLASGLTWAEEIVAVRRAHHALRSGHVVAPIAMTCAGALTFALPTSVVRNVLLSLLAGGAAMGALCARAGRDASDDMQMLIGVSLAAAVGPWTNDVVRRCALAAIACQLSVCYIVSACAKVGGQRWRDGTAVSDVLATETFGVGWAPEGFRRTWAAVSWTVIALELALPVSFLLGGPVLVPAMALGLAFHLGIASTMGLSRFSATWAAGYVAVYWWSGHYGLLC